MLRPLKVVMAIWGAIAVITGLSFIFVPERVAQLYDLGQIADPIRWIIALSGAIFIAVGSWFVVASRDPIRHINWVKYGITKSLLGAVVTAYSIFRGDVNFRQAGMILILFAVFAALLLVFYPWRYSQMAARDSVK